MRKVHITIKGKAADFVNPVVDGPSPIDFIEVPEDLPIAEIAYELCLDYSNWVVSAVDEAITIDFDSELPRLSGSTGKGFDYPEIYKEEESLNSNSPIQTVSMTPVLVPIAGRMTALGLRVSTNRNSPLSNEHENKDSNKYDCPVGILMNSIRYVGMTCAEEEDIEKGKELMSHYSRLLLDAIGEKYPNFESLFKEYVFDPDPDFPDPSLEEMFKEREEV